MTSAPAQANPFGIGGHRGPGDPQTIPATTSGAYGSGAASSSMSRIPTLVNPMIGGDMGGSLGMTPPASPRFYTPPASPRFPAPPTGGGTTRRDRTERADERRAARAQSRATRSAESAENIEERMQDWVTRLIAAERNARDTAQ